MPEPKGDEKEHIFADGKSLFAAEPRPELKGDEEGHIFADGKRLFADTVERGLDHPR